MKNHIIIERTDCLSVNYRNRHEGITIELMQLNSDISNTLATLVGHPSSNDFW